jgi:hypothetical protein
MKKLIKTVLSYIPTRLPTGMSAYNIWLDSIVELTGPIADEASLHWVISNEVMRLNSNRDRISKAYFVRTLRKYAANQIAASAVLEIKAKQQALLDQQKAEDTAKTEAVPNGPLQRV